MPPGTGLPNEGAVVSFAGFGFTSNDDNEPLPSLQIGSQTVISQDECINYFPHLRTHGISHQHFCAINTENYTSICGGDQGNGLYMEWVGGVNILAGVSSAIRVANCSAHYPALHTRANEYTDWIGSFL